MRWLLLLSLAACTYDATDDAIWTGTITRDGSQVAFAGYDPEPFQGFQFGASPETMGYIDDGDSKLLVQILLHFVNENFAIDRPTPPFTLPVQKTFMSGEKGMGIEYLERPAADQDKDFDVEPTYQVRSSESEPGSITGNFTITDTDLSTFLDGDLQATLMDARGGTRQLTMKVHWLGQK